MSSAQPLSSTSVPQSCPYPDQPLYSQGSFTFDVNTWRGIQSAVAAQVRCEPEELGQLHEIEQAQGNVPRKNCNRTKGKRRNDEVLSFVILQLFLKSSLYKYD